MGDVKKSVEKALREANQSARTERRKTRFSDGGGGELPDPARLRAANKSFAP